jgi:hypothetical protein
LKASAICICNPFYKARKTFPPEGGSAHSSDPGRLAAGGYKKGLLFTLVVVHLPGPEWRPINRHILLSKIPVNRKKIALIKQKKHRKNRLLEVPHQGVFRPFYVALSEYFSQARIIHEDFYCNRQLHTISSRARSLRFDVLQVRLQGNSLRLA